MTLELLLKKMLLFGIITMIPNIAFADELRSTYKNIRKQVFEKPYPSVDEKRLLAQELELKIDQNNNSPARGQAVLLLAHLNIDLGNFERTEILLQKAIKETKFSEFDEMQIRTLLGSLYSGHEPELALTEYKRIVMLASKILLEKDSLNSKVSFIGKTPLQLVTSSYRIASERLASRFFETGQTSKAAAILDSYGHDIIKAVLLYNSLNEEYMIASATDAWCSAAVQLNDRGLRKDANRLCSRALENIESIESKNERLEEALFQVKILKTYTAHKNPIEATAKVSSLLKEYSGENWCIRSMLRLTRNMNETERFAILSQLLKNYNEPSDHPGLADLYYHVGMCAYRLGIDSEAFQTLESFLRLFPEHGLRNYVESLLGTLRTNQESAWEELSIVNSQIKEASNESHDSENTIINKNIKQKQDVEKNSTLNAVPHKKVNSYETNSMNSHKYSFAFLLMGFVLVLILFIIIVLFGRKTKVNNLMDPQT